MTPSEFEDIFYSLTELQEIYEDDEKLEAMHATVVAKQILRAYYNGTAFEFEGIELVEARLRGNK